MKNILLRILTMALSICMIATIAIFPASASESNSLTIPTMEQLNDDGSLPLGLSSVSSETDIEKLTADELMLIILRMSVEMDSGEMSMDSFIPLLPAISRKIYPIITDSDFITIVNNKEYPESFRYFFLDMYPQVKTTNSTQYNEALMSVSTDNFESNFIRISSANKLIDNDEKAEVLYSLYDQADENEKPIIIKRLSLLNSPKANMLAKQVLNDYASYGENLISLANKTLVRTMQGVEDKELIFKINKEFLDKKEPSFAQMALLALAEIRDADTVKFVFENADFATPAMQTFVKKNFKQVTDYLDTAPVEEVNRCITAVPIKEFRTYLTDNSSVFRAKSALDTETLLKAIDDYNNPVDITSRARKGYLDYPAAAAYRDGVFGKFEWHAAIILPQNQITDYDFLQATGVNHKVKFVQEATFLDKGSWMGIRQWNGITLSEERDVMNLAGSLASEGISYTVTTLMYARIAGISWIEPEHITDMRCDGVVEYVYEYNSLKVQGVPNCWNISRVQGGYNSHNGITYTPEKQANSEYFIKIPYSG